MTRAAVVLPCADIAATQAFFEELGFRVEAVSPADDPVVVVIAGHGVRLRLDRRAHGDPGVVRLESSEVRTVIAPNGTRVELAAPPALFVPPLIPSFHVDHARDAHWHVGRAGMRYRDLIPDRQGGRVIASHIQIAEAGPVPDYVHYHAIRYQLIYCHRGWVRVVYEDQGPSFVMEPGDCVLQPPRIRHRVLEAAAGTEVVEVGSPASHDTFADHAMELPTSALRPDRDYGGQRFARGVDAIAAATGGLVEVGVTGASAWECHDGELVFLFVLAGAATLRRDGGDDRLDDGDSVVVPAGMRHAVTDATHDLRILRVRVAR
jgi:quercetin dioxygenase-like cupin family protein